MEADLLREAAEIGHVGARLTIDTNLYVARWMTAPHVDLFAAAAQVSARDYAELGSWVELARLWESFERFERDEHPDPGAALEGAAERFGIESYQQMFWSSWFSMSAHTHPERALAILDANARALPALGQPAFVGAWSSLRAVIVGLVRLGERARAAGFYPLVLEMASHGHTCEAAGLTESTAGIAAAAGEQWDAAERHFERALIAAYELPHVPEQADVRYWHAWMLLARHGEGDAERARAMLLEAAPMFERSGRRRRLRECGELIASAGDHSVR
jgi:hypothetical protein